MKYVLILCLLLTGCLQQPHGSTKPIVKKQRQIGAPPSPTPVIPVHELEVSGDIVANLSRYLGTTNTITIKSPLTIKQKGMTIAFPAGTQIDYVTHSDSCLFTFSQPYPVVTVTEWGLDFHPVLTAIALNSPNKGIASVLEGGFSLRRNFVLDWESEETPRIAPDAKIVPTPLELPSEIVKPRQTPKTESQPLPPLPTLWAFGDYSPNSICEHCKKGYKELSEYEKMNPMPCVVVWNPKGVKPPAGTGTPYFMWPRKGEITPSGTKSDWKLEGWWSVEYLLQEFHRTRKLDQQTSTPTKIAGMHSHKCPRCGTIWSHGREAAGNSMAHSCPKCGTRQYDIYQGGRT